MLFFTKSYEQTIAQIVKDAIFDEECQNMVIVKDIEIYSLCEHHLITFFGKVSVGYLPNHKIIGLSKIARIIEIFSRRLQGSLFVHFVNEAVQPLGVGVIVECV